MLTNLYCQKFNQWLLEREGITEIHEEIFREKRDIYTILIMMMIL